MPFPVNLPASLQALLFGDPFGRVFPPRGTVPAATQQRDGRTVALELLKQYLAALIFYCPTGRGSPPRAFQLQPDNIWIEVPGAETELKFPSVVVLGSRADYDAIGLVSYVEEETIDQYSPGTVVQWQAEYRETINLELYASQEPELRSLLAGIETAISPTEQMSGLRFRMPDYFNELVCFTLNRRENYNDADGGKGRRHAQVELEMRLNIVALVDYVPMQPLIEVDTGSDGQTSQPLNLALTPPVIGQDQEPNPTFVGYPGAVDAIPVDNTNYPPYLYGQGNGK